MSKLGDLIKSITPEKASLIKKIIKWVVIGLVIIGVGLGVYFGITSRQFKEIFTSSDEKNTEVIDDDGLGKTLDDISGTIFGKKKTDKKTDKKKK